MAHLIQKIGTNKKAIRRFAFTLLSWIILAASLLVPTVTQAQPFTHTRDYIQDWLIAGPVDQSDLDNHFLKKTPAPGDVFISEAGDSLSWTSYSSTFRSINLRKVLNSSTQYALSYTTLNSPRSQEVAFSFGSSGPVKVLVNGKVVYENNKYILYTIDDVHFHAALRPGSNSILVINRMWQSDWTFSLSNPLTKKPVVHGVVSNQQGERLNNTELVLYCGNTVFAQTTSSVQGDYQIKIPEVQERCRLKASHEDLGTWLSALPSPESNSNRRNLTLQKTAFISGQLFHFDGITPQHAVHLEAVRKSDSRIMASTLTDENGEYTLENIPPGTYFIRSGVLPAYTSPNQNEAWSIPSSTSQEIEVQIRGRTPQRNVDLRLPGQKKGYWTSWTSLDGLPYFNISDLEFTKNQLLLSGTNGGGVFTFDGSSFKTFKIQDGLYSNHIFDVFLESEGKYLIASNRGLNRIVNGKVVEQSDEVGLKDIHVRDITRDSDGVLWFATEHGLFKQGPDSSITSIRTSPELPSSRIWRLEPGSDDKLWIGTSLGLAYLQDDKIAVVDDLVGYRIYDIYATSNKDIWISTEKGLFRWRNGMLNTKSYTTSDGIINNQIRELCESEDGILWVNSDAGGISAFDGTHFTNYTMQDGLISENPRSVQCGGYKSVWIGTENGLSLLDYSITAYGEMDGLIHASERNKFAGLLSINYANPNSIYLGSEWGGLFKFDGSRLHRLFKMGTGPYVRTMLPKPSSAGTGFFLGTHDGLLEYSPSSTRFLSMDNWIITSAPGEDNTIWTGHGWTGQGLKRIDAETGQLRQQITTEDGLPSDNIWSIETAADGGLWLGTDQGISKFKDGQIQNLTEKYNFDPFSIHDILDQGDGTIWLAGNYGVFRLRDGTLSHFSPDGLKVLDNNSWKLVDPSLALPDDTYWTIHTTHEGITWFGSQSHGAFAYDGTAISVFDGRYGLLGNQVMAITSDSSGLIWFGTNDGGLTQYDRTRQPVHIEIESIRSKGNTYALDQEMPDLQADNPISITYRAIDLRTSSSNRQFLIAIFDEDGDTILRKTTRNNSFVWTPTSKGSYSISIQAINQDLFYSTPAQTTLSINWPLTRNPLFLFSALSILLSWIGIYLSLNKRYSQQKKESRSLQKKMLVQEQEARKSLEEKNKLLKKAYDEAEKAKQEAQQATIAKSMFLSNMSHELRTPMNGVIGMTSLLMSTPLNEEQFDFVETIRGSGETLLAIINDILDFSKIEANKIELEAIEFDLRKCVEEVLEVVSPLATSKELSLAYFMPESSPEFVIQDITRVKQVLTNLLSNALKFTHEGFVSVRIHSESIDAEHSKYTFAVKDTGIGIPENRIDNLFESFTQVDASTTRRFGGTGLGLAISKRLSQLLGGDLWVESVEGSGSTFTFAIQVTHPESLSSPSSLPSHPFSKCSILVAGFSTFENHVIEHHLEALDLEIISVKTLQEALKMHDLAPDALVASVPLLNSLQEVELVQSTFPGLPVIRCLQRDILIPRPKEPHILHLYRPLKPRSLQTGLLRLLHEAAARDLAASTDPNSSLSKTFAPLRILLHDSNPIQQKIVLKMLDQFGYSADVVASKRELIDKLKRSTYEVILIDLHEVEMDALHKVLGKSGNKGSSFLIAVSPTGKRPEDRLSARIDVCIEKPYQMNQLMGALHQARKRSKSRSEVNHDQNSHVKT